MPKPSQRKVEIKCSQCGNKKTVRLDSYNKNVTKNGSYLCHECATRKAAKEGKYAGDTDKRSSVSKALWGNKEYRAKITNASIERNTTEQYKKSQRDRSKILWDSDQYRISVSQGVKNSMADEEVRDKISESLRTKWQEEYYRSSVLKSLKRAKISSIQLDLYNYLDDLKVQYHKEGENTTFGYYVFDCYIPEHRLLIECQGDCRHSLPNTIRNDKSKFTYITKYFPDHQIMYIWEHEFYEKDGVLDRLKLRLKIDLDTVDFKFSDLVSRRIERQLSNSFLQRYHYLGKSRGGCDYGLYLGEDLIAVASFSPLLRQNVAHQFPANSQELSRLCVHPRYHKKNLLSWWISRIPIRPIVAYADTTVGHTGAVYKASGFVLHHVTSPDYWYCSEDGYVMHKKTLYNRAVKVSLTEREFAERYGYYKKYGGSKLCFVKQK